MNKMRRVGLFSFLACLFIGLMIVVVVADDDDEEHGKDGFGSVDNVAYKEQCGACHLAYQPALLPSESWRKILSGLENHNDADVVIEPEDMAIIERYLQDNAAEFSSAKRAVKIVRSLKGQAPTRITEVPYIRRKHHEIPANVVKRESVGSFSRCDACHVTADRGIYEDDYVTIPE